jgi:hypothetical protein
MTKTEKGIVQGLAPIMREPAVVVMKVEKATRKKITKEMIRKYEEMPLAQEVTNTQGERVLKSNPEMQEFRATVQLYCSIVKTMQAVFTDQAAPAEDDEINAIRQKLKIAR